ncbi:MAG: MmgE/PrpD family protein [Candidatus Dormibacteraceae bacterium]
MSAKASLTSKLASYWANVRFQDLPGPVIAAAKRALLDTIAAALAGSDTEVAKFALIGASAGEAAGSAGVWGTSCHLPPSLAALVNGVAAHALEMDDFSGAGHIGASVVPTLTAIADGARVSGAEALVAIAAGYDIADRVGEGLGGYRSHNDRGWHSTGTCGGFGCAAAGARLLGLDGLRFRHALGIAGTYTGGTWAFLADGSMTKRYHAGRAAESGVLAAQFADAGFDGPAEVLEAAWGGVLPTFAGTAANPSAVVRDLGKVFKILDDGIKPYACCRGSHGAVEAVLGLIADEAIPPASIERIIFHGPPQAIRQLGGRNPMTAVDGQFSLPYTLAVAVAHGRVTPDLFRPLRTDDPLVRTMIDRVHLVDDREVGEKGEADVEMMVASHTYRRQIKIPLGDPRRMLSIDQLHAKARGLVTPILGGEKAEAMVDLVARFEHVPDCRELTSLLGR